MKTYNRKKFKSVAWVHAILQKRNYWRVWKIEWVTSSDEFSLQTNWSTKLCSPKPKVRIILLIRTCLQSNSKTVRHLCEKLSNLNFSFTQSCCCSSFYKNISFAWYVALCFSFWTLKFKKYFHVINTLLVIAIFTSTNINKKFNKSLLSFLLKMVNDWSQTKSFKAGLLAFIDWVVTSCSVSECGQDVHSLINDKNIPLTIRTDHSPKMIDYNIWKKSPPHLRLKPMISSREWLRSTKKTMKIWSRGPYPIHPPSTCT